MASPATTKSLAMAIKRNIKRCEHYLKIMR